MTMSSIPVPKKPKAAVLNQQNATLNIQTKISIIEAWINDGIPQKIDGSGNPVQTPSGKKELDFYPTSLRQFNFWERSKHCPAVIATLRPFWRNANDTLRRNSPLRDQVVSLLKQLVKRGERESKTEEPTVAALRRNLAVAETRKAVVEAHFSGQRKKIRELEQAVSNLEAKMHASLDEAAKANVQLQAEVASLRSEKAELAKALMTVKPFRAVP